MKNVLIFPSFSFREEDKKLERKKKQNKWKIKMEKRNRKLFGERFGLARSVYTYKYIYRWATISIYKTQFLCLNAYYTLFSSCRSANYCSLLGQLFVLVVYLTLIFFGLSFFPVYRIGFPTLTLFLYLFLVPVLSRLLCF